MLNQIVLQGRLVREVELKKTNSGLAVTEFSIACDRDYRKDEEKQCDFINCVAWRSTAEFISKYFHKGDMMLITGSLRMRKYTTKDGQNRTVYEVLVDNVNFCGSKRSSGSNVDTANAQNAAFEEMGGSTEGLPWSETDDGELPF